MLGVLARLGEGLEAEADLTATCTAALAQLGAPRAALFVQPQAGMELMALASCGLPPAQLAELRRRLNEPNAAAHLAAGRPFALETPGFDHSAPAAAVIYGCQALGTGPRGWGALCLELPAGPPAQTDEAWQRLELAAGGFALALRAARRSEAHPAEPRAENRRFRFETADRPASALGNSSRMRAALRAVRQVGPSDAPVLVLGEPGTGRELIARSVHASSRRAAGPFVRVDCAGGIERQLENELFGEEGGPMPPRPGQVERAAGGTLYLAEIGDLSAVFQVKLLRLLQEKEYEPGGSGQVRRSDVRLIVSTAADLEKLVAEGRFRPDLYYSLGVFPIPLPPLRERRGDILPLADNYLSELSQRGGKVVRRLTPEAARLLQAYHWPDNVRELENCLEQAAQASTDGAIHAYHLPAAMQMPDPVGGLTERVAAFERDLIADALKRTDGNMAAAARELRTTPRIVRYKIRKLGIDLTPFAGSQ